MGRNKRPIGVRMMDGTYDEARHGRPLATKPGAPVMPDWLDEVGQKYWHKTLAELGDIQGLLTGADADTLSIYADSWSTYLRCRETLVKEGMTVRGREGLTVKHPATVLKRQAENTILNIASKFGLTPVSRALLAIDAASVVNGVRRRQHFSQNDLDVMDLIR